MSSESSVKVFFGRIAGIVVFLILIAIANLLTFWVYDAMYIAIVGFFDENLFFLIAMALMFLMAEMFALFIFPFNVPYPVFNAVGGVMVVNFLFRIWEFVSSFTGHPFFDIIGAFEVLIAFIVFFATLIIGYAKILSKLMKKYDINEKKAEKPAKAKKELSKRVSWDDVENEFRLAFYGLGRMFRRTFDKPDNRKRKR